MTNNDGEWGGRAREAREPETTPSPGSPHSTAHPDGRSVESPPMGAMGGAPGGPSPAMEPRAYGASPSRSGHGVSPSRPGPPGQAAYPRPSYAPPAVHGPDPRLNQRYSSGSRRQAGLGATAAVALIASLLGGAGGAGIMYGLIEPTSDETAAEQPAEIRTIASDEGVNWAAVAEDVRPSVVAIESITAAGGSTGSGVIIDADGHIITNHHVIAGTQQIMVTLSDGEIIAADVVGSDASTDLAVLRLESIPEDISPARLGSSENLVVGEPVVAIGNPLGLSSTVTTGIISALDRPVVTREGSSSDAVVTNAIQIDAAINPGNSGGPLFNAEGEVIGINSSIASLSSADGGTAGSIGLGFAIPIDLADRVVTDLLDDGTVDHAFIGVTTTSEVVTVDGSNQVAARIVDVSPGSPAAEYGLEQGDAILSINGDRLASNTALTGYVRQYAPGETVTLEVARGGSVTEIDLVLGERD